jgi:hypothetical protein
VFFRLEGEQPPPFFCWGKDRRREAEHVTIDRIYIAGCRVDYPFTRCCVASIRRWYPKIPITLIKDESHGAYDTRELESYWDVEPFKTATQVFGWGWPKLEPLFLATNERCLIIDSDIVFIGKVLDRLEEHEDDFIVAEVSHPPEEIKAHYFDLEKLKRFDPDFVFPNYTFNTGQMVVTTGILKRQDFEPFVRFSEPRRLLHPDVFKLNDQGLLNYVLGRKYQLGEISLRRVEFMWWAGWLEEHAVELERLDDDSPYPFLVHWAGPKEASFHRARNADLLRYFEALYYSGVAGGVARGQRGPERRPGERLVEGISGNLVQPKDPREAGDRGPSSKATTTPSVVEPSSASWARWLTSLMLRTSRGPFRVVWALAHSAVMHGVAAHIRRMHARATVFVKGSFAAGDPVYGLSDVDLVVVVPGEAERPGLERERVRERWDGLCRRWPFFRQLVQHFGIYEQDDFEKSTSSCLTYGLTAHEGAGPNRAAVLGARPLPDEMCLQVHPGLPGPAREWKLVAGRECRLARSAEDRQLGRISLWLELQWWWRYAFEACLDPTRRHVPFLCVKLIAEPLRLWLWHVRGELVNRRRDILERALREFPAEEESIRLALDLYAALPRSPAGPLERVLPALVRISRLLVQEIERELVDEGFTDVPLLWVKEGGLVAKAGACEQLKSLVAPNGELRLLPLADWRARALPEVPDEIFALVGGDATQPAVLAATARAGRMGVYPALRCEELLILPGLPAWQRGVLRAVQCAATDPVSFALAEERETARFPNVAGWSAYDSARRAVAEHHAWLTANERTGRSPYWEAEYFGITPELRKLGMLFTSARAALFLESLEAGRPELPLTVAAVAHRLSARGGRAQSIVTDAHESLRAARQEGGVPSPGTLTAMHELVGQLPTYAQADARLMLREIRQRLKDHARVRAQAPRSRAR